MTLKNKITGFTLIELMIVVAVVAIIAGVALPAYRSYVLKAGRAEGKAALVDVAAKQEQYFLDNKTYTNDMTKLGYGADPYRTESDKYNVDATAASATGFTLQATAYQHQAEDTECGNYTLDSTGTKGITGSGSVSDCW